MNETCYQVKLQIKPEMKVTVEEVNSLEALARMTSYYSYIEEGTQGLIAVRGTKEEAVKALIEGLKKTIKYHEDEIAKYRSYIDKIEVEEWELIYQK